MSIVPKLIYRLNIIPIKIPTSFFAEIDNVILKFIEKCKGPRLSKTILKKTHFILPSLKIYNSQQSGSKQGVWVAQSVR